MKKLLLFALSICAISTFAQSALQITDHGGNNVTNGVATLAGPNSPTDLFAKLQQEFTITNTGSTSIDVKCKRYEMSALSGSSNYHCFGQTCYSDINAGAASLFPTPSDAEYLDYITVASGSATNVYTYIKPKAAVGSASFRFVLYDSNNSSDSVFVDVTFSVWDSSNGIDDLKNDLSAKVQPNPANAATRLVLSGNKNESGSLTVEVMDLLGKRHQNIQVPASQQSVEINTSDLNAGIYLLSIKKEGELIRTSRLVVKH